MNNTKTFRLFISSTFSDFQLERRVLHEKVFPEIDKHCTEQGYQFQPVDLRWGVNNEAQLDQKTLELCLNEVRACKHFPHPNFLIMLGNRYGWVSLPYAIKKSEFESILDFYTNNSSALQLLNEWYIEDSNHLIEDLHAYVLKPREPKGAYADWQDWEKLENELRALLQDAANALFKGTPQYTKYFLSATEAEVQEGIFKYLQPTKFQLEMQEEYTEISEIDQDYVYGFVRSINDHETADLSNEPAKSFIDKDQTNVTNFKKELIENTLNKSNLLPADVTLSGDINNPFTDKSYLLEFETFMIDKLKLAVNKQIAEAQEISQLTQERSEQQRFQSLKTKVFFGREEELEVIQKYIDSDNTQPFIVHGVSGIGKSSFMAKVIEQTEEALIYTIADRFIGVTSSSSNTRALLESLINDLAAQKVLVLPETLKQDNNQFNQQVKELLLTIEKPTVIILDALDQLQNKDYLQWLPLELPSNLKIILSMLDQKGYEHYYDLLKNKLDKKNQLNIEALNDAAATQTLKSLLKKEKHSLTPQQFEYTLEKFRESKSSPLYLKIAFEEVKTWKSTDTNEELRVGIQEVIKEFIDNLTEKYHHSPKIVHKLLGLIYASKNGLSEKEILDLLSRDESILTDLEEFNKLDLTIDGETVRRFPISIWARLHEQLKPFINERTIDNQNLISFFHRQIDEAVHNCIYKENSQLLHKELADYFLTLQDKDKLWDKRYYNLHMLEETPYQLFHAKDGKRLKEILIDLEFSGSVYNNHKEETFTEVLEKAVEIDGITDDEIDSWKKFFLEKAHLITGVDGINWRASQSLFQLAYEDGDNSPLSHNAEQLLEKDRVDFLWLKKRNRPKKFKRTGLLKVLEGHSDTIFGTEIFKDGRILSYSVDNTLRLWDSEGEPLRILEGHTSAVKGAKILEDGKILSYSRNETLRLWSSEGEALRILEGHTYIVSGVEILEDGRILSYSADNTLRLWSSEGEALRILEGHTSAVKGAKILEDGKILSYSEDNTLRLWSSEGEPLRILEGHTDYVSGVKILEDGRILSYSADNTLRLWSSEGEPLRILEGHTGFVNGVAVLEDGRILSYSGVAVLEDGRIPSYSKDKTLRLWSSEGEPLRILEGHTSTVKGAKILEDGRILSYSADNTLRLWSNEGKALAVLEGHTSYVNGIEILEDGRILSYSADNTLRLWSSEGEPLRILEGHTGFVNGVAVLEDRRILSYSADNTLRLWSNEEKALAVLEGHTDHVSGAEILEDEKILSYSWDKTLRLWSSEGEPLRILEGHTSFVNGAKVLEDGRILSYSEDNTLRLWSSEGEPLRILEGHTSAVKGAKILEDGKILSYSKDKTLRLWSNEGKALAILEGHTSYISGAKILEDGRILSYSVDKTLRLWSSEGEPLRILEGHTDNVSGAKILEDGRILSYSWDDTLRLWSSEGEPLRILEGHTRAVIGAKILVDGRILSYSSDVTLRLWSNQGKALAVLEGHTGFIDGAKILENGRILSCSYDKTLRLWSNEGEKLCLWNIAVESISFNKVTEKSFLALSDKYLLIYDFYDGNEAISINVLAKELENSLYEDGI
ncbi:AAA family ATPase [Sulfurimonas aquatica]|uniref:AAA family ATPase n=1 Tax=Sulfurimonas aquatica TaxID=2672570 RepID=UPI001A985682|nr:AAA family ATPase [Sulfurimonas aquatica]